MTGAGGDGRGVVPETDVDSALGRAALLFRWLAVVWMAVMVAITLSTDPEASRPVVAGAMAIAVGGAIWSSRWLTTKDRLDTPHLVADGIVAIAVAVSPLVAGAADAFYGGYPMSSVVIVALAAGVAWGLAAAGVFALTQLVALVAGSPSGPSPSDWTSLVVMAAVVALVVGLGAAYLRRAEERRSRAEKLLEEERRRNAVDHARMAERLSVADDLHDSVLQTVRVLAQHADDPTRVRSLARRQERELRNVIERMHGGTEGVAAVLRRESSDVEELHGVEVDVIAVADVEIDDRTTELVRAAREAIVNAARHSGSSRIDVTLEPTPDRITVIVRDRGRGFDPSLVASGHGVAAVQDRLSRLGGSVDVSSVVGEGTEVELSIPRVSTK